MTIYLYVRAGYSDGMDPLYQPGFAAETAEEIYEKPAHSGDQIWRIRDGRADVFAEYRSKQRMPDGTWFGGGLVPDESVKIWGWFAGQGRDWSTETVLLREGQDPYKR